MNQRNNIPDLEYSKGVIYIYGLLYCKYIHLCNVVSDITWNAKITYWYEELCQGHEYNGVSLTFFTPYLIR